MGTDPEGPPDRVVPIVVVRGAAWGLLLAMPAAFAQGVFLDQTPRPRGAVNLTFLLVMVGFVVAGFAAGREAPGQAAKHGALAAVAAFVPVEVVAVLGRLDRGDPVRIVGIVIIGLFAAVAGSVGGQLGAARRNRGTS